MLEAVSIYFCFKNCDPQATSNHAAKLAATLQPSQSHVAKPSQRSRREGDRL